MTTGKCSPLLASADDPLWASPQVRSSVIQGLQLRETGAAGLGVGVQKGTLQEAMEGFDMAVSRLSMATHPDCSP